ncbi:GrlR family regulatory protein [Dyella sp. 20L07]|uniref:GrlR family regulatory protein n=1 Tax=Dyella sp. 20L07 TaxID=3384240 RepID=UPI003D2B3960
MSDGIYEVTFYQDSARQADFGTGIVTIKDGSINGGDEGFIYRGRLTYVEARVTGRIHVSKWSQALPSVFSGLDDYHLDFTGDFNGGSLDGWGSIIGQPGLTLFVSAHRVGDAA